MDKIIKALFQVSEFKFRTDDDFVDRLNRQYTPTLMVLFTVLVSAKQYVGEPISCWCPAQFTQSHTDYTNTVCWVSNTYYVPFGSTLPLLSDPRHHISYYQWVPVLLLCQGALFFAPCIGWRFFNRRTGLSLPAIIEAAHNAQKAIYPETKEKTIRYMVLQLDGYLLRNRGSRKGRCQRLRESLARVFCFLCHRVSGNYLTFIYLATKVLYIANAVSQLFLLDWFLGMNQFYHLYGVHVLLRFLSGGDWSLSERFPRVTLCDFQIRQQTNLHRYTVQCVLPINLFNEKIFLFIWFWLLFVAASTVFNLLHWVSKTVLLPLQVSFIRRQLKVMDLNKREVKTVRKFTESYLRRDGILVIRLIAKNAGDLIAAELIHGLWANYGPDRRGMGADGRGGDTGGRRGGGGGGGGGGRTNIMTAQEIAPAKRTTGTRWSVVKKILVKSNSQGDQNINRDDGNFIRVGDI